MAEPLCKCKVCNNDLNAHNDVALSCDTCNLWHCYTCMNVDQQIFEALEGKDTSMIKFSCGTCLAVSYPINIAKSIEVVRKDMSELAKKLDTFKDVSLTKVEESIEILKVQKQEATDSWANIVRLNLESTRQLSEVRDSVKVCGKGQIEIEEKEKSIVIFHMAENNKENRIERQNEDLSLLKDFMEVGLCIPAQDIQSCFRLGRFEADKVRPIKITFSHKSSQIKVLDNLSALSRAEEKFKKVSVSIDRDAHERAELQTLVKRAKEQTLASADTRYVVRGTFKPYIHEFAKNT